MAENKKSFVLYADIWHTINKINDTDAGLLFKHLLMYVNDMNPQTDNLIVEVCFEPIKQTLKRDLQKWDKFRDKQSKNGKLGGRPAKENDKPIETQINPNNPSLNLETQKSLSVSVSDSVIVSDSVSVNENKEITIEKNNKYIIPKKTKKEISLELLDKRKDELKLRKLAFFETIKKYQEKYTSETLNKFATYWSEPTHTFTQMKFEKCPTWDVGGRLATWFGNQDKYNKSSNKSRLESNVDAVMKANQELINQNTFKND